MKGDRIGRPAVFVLSVMGLLALLCGIGGAFRAHRLLYETLHGRQVLGEPPTSVSAFTLRAEMVSAQMDTRMRGWMSFVPGEEVAVQSARGNLIAWSYPAVYGEEDAPWALVIHGGLGTDHTQVTDIACMLSLAGYRVLTPDLYGHGQSEGELSSLGAADAQDVQAWVRWILSETPGARVVMMGIDEGATAALMAVCQGLPEAVKAVAADSACLHVQACLQQKLAEKQSKANALDVFLIEKAYCVAFGGFPDAEDAAARLAQANMPLLFIHGTGDEQTPAWHSEDLAARSGGKLLYIEGAAHGMARFVDADGYEKALLGFFEAALAE